MAISPPKPEKLQNLITEGVVAITDSEGQFLSACPLAKIFVEVKRGFGKLIISQIAAYGCRLLFKELKKAIQ